ncbi:uncharacterized protein LOC110755228 [Prunus avium]|uniref:Uncharacterized protein LOC110755228 n=1 Tax=Prunus avium TaxID=42229 RepID=A0A6P5S513_PRUAV|nr:uncharacterized protein LOC110755228 [Prunus avium]
MLEVHSASAWGIVHDKESFNAMKLTLHARASPQLTIGGFALSFFINPHAFPGFFEFAEFLELTIGGFALSFFINPHAFPGFFEFAEFLEVCVGVSAHTVVDPAEFVNLSAAQILDLQFSIRWLLVKNIFKGGKPKNNHLSCFSYGISYVISASKSSFGNSSFSSGNNSSSSSSNYSSGNSSFGKSSSSSGNSFFGNSSSSSGNYSSAYGNSSSDNSSFGKSSSSSGNSSSSSGNYSSAYGNSSSDNSSFGNSGSLSSSSSSSSGAFYRPVFILLDQTMDPSGPFIW